MALIVKGSDLIDYLNSPGFKEYNRKIEEIGRRFEELDSAQRQVVGSVIADQLRKNEGRSELIEQERAEDDEFEKEEIAEYERLTDQIPEWFPSLAAMDREELSEYAYALVDYHLRKSKVN